MGRGRLAPAAAAALALAVPAAALAQEPARWYLQVDNDVVFHEDRWYTSGVRLSRVVPRGPVEWEASLVQEVYTPDALEAHPVDRAPTARLLAALARHERSAASFTTIELALGVRGPSALGEAATDFVHRIVPAEDVDWSREEGDQLDAQLTVSRRDAFGPWRTHVGAVAGTEIAFAHAGLAWHFGAVALDSPLLRFAPTPPWEGTARGWGGFLGLGARYVGRNEMLGRPYREGMAALEREKLVGRAAAGLSWAGEWGRLAFALAVDSREFEQQAQPHRFGSLTLHIPF